MATETEVKVELVDLQDFRRRIAGPRCSLIAPRHFEDNFLLDYPDGRMRAGSSIVRVRFAQDRAWITYKGPPRPEGVFKAREELESEVGDGAAVCRILESLGLRVWFRYQKYREEFALILPGTPEDAVHVAVDETPVGNYAEFEGCEDAIRTAASEMGFDESKFLRSSYYSLYMQHCRERGKPAGFMVFHENGSTKGTPMSRG